MSTLCSQLSTPLKGGLRKPLRAVVRRWINCFEALSEMSKELLAQPNGITRILALSKEHEAADLELPSLLSKRWFLVTAWECLLRFWLCRWISLNTKHLQRCRRSRDPQGFNVSGWRVCNKPRKIQQKWVFGATGSLQEGGHLMPWPGCGCKTLGPSSCAEINSIPTHLQGWLGSRLTCSSQNHKHKFWHPPCIYSPLQSSSRTLLSLKPPLEATSQFTRKKPIYSPETKGFSPALQQVSHVKAWKVMPQPFWAASPRTAAKKAFHWCSFPCCQCVLSDTLPRQHSSWVRTSPSAPEPSSYKHWFL